MSGIGGTLQVIYKQAEGKILGIDATTQIPQSFKNISEELPSYGYSTIGIPGVVAGLVKLQKENGFPRIQANDGPRSHSESCRRDKNRG